MGNPKSGRARLRELFITKFKSQFKWGFAKVVVTRAGRLRKWSQGEPSTVLYSHSASLKPDIGTSELTAKVTLRWISVPSRWGFMLEALLFCTLQ